MIHLTLEKYSQLTKSNLIKHRSSQNSMHVVNCKGDQNIFVSNAVKTDQIRISGCRTSSEYESTNEHDVWEEEGGDLRNVTSISCVDQYKSVGSEGGDGPGSHECEHVGKAHGENSGEGDKESGVVESRVHKGGGWKFGSEKSDNKLDNVFRDLERTCQRTADCDTLTKLVIGNVNSGSAHVTTEIITCDNHNAVESHGIRASQESSAPKAETSCTIQCEELTVKCENALLHETILVEDHNDVGRCEMSLCIAEESHSITDHDISKWKGNNIHSGDDSKSDEYTEPFVVAHAKKIASGSRKVDLFRSLKKSIVEDPVDVVTFDKPHIITNVQEQKLAEIAKVHQKRHEQFYTRVATDLEYYEPRSQDHIARNIQDIKALDTLRHTGSRMCNDQNISRQFSKELSRPSSDCVDQSRQQLDSDIYSGGEGYCEGHLVELVLYVQRCHGLSVMLLMDEDCNNIENYERHEKLVRRQE